MAITRLQQQRKKNKIILDKKLKLLKHLSSKPVIKNVNINEIKKSFNAPAKRS